MGRLGNISIDVVVALVAFGVIGIPVGYDQYTTWMANNTVEGPIAPLLDAIPLLLLVVVVIAALVEFKR